MNEIPALPVYGFDANLGGFLSFAAAVVLPVLAGLLTKQSWPGSVKGTVLLVLAFAKTIIEAWLAALTTSAHFDFWPVFYTTAFNFAVAVVSYFGLLKDTKVVAAAQQTGIKDGGRVV